MATPTSPLLQMPTEVLQHILVFLPPKDLFHFQRINWHIYKLLNSLPPYDSAHVWRSAVTSMVSLIFVSHGVESDSKRCFAGELPTPSSVTPSSPVLFSVVVSEGDDSDSCFHSQSSASTTTESESASSSEWTRLVQWKILLKNLVCQLEKFERERSGVGVGVPAVPAVPDISNVVRTILGSSLVGRTETSLDEIERNRSLISVPLRASTTDDPSQHVHNTLRDRDESVLKKRRSTFWSSKGTEGPDTDDWLLYALKGPQSVCQQDTPPAIDLLGYGITIVKALEVKFFSATWQADNCYCSQKIRCDFFQKQKGELLESSVLLFSSDEMLVEPSPEMIRFEIPPKPIVFVENLPLAGEEEDSLNGSYLSNMDCDSNLHVTRVVQEKEKTQEKEGEEEGEEEERPFGQLCTFEDEDPTPFIQQAKAFALPDCFYVQDLASDLLVADDPQGPVSLPSLRRFVTSVVSEKKRFLRGMETRLRDFGLGSIGIRVGLLGKSVQQPDDSKFFVCVEELDVLGSTFVM